MAEKVRAASAVVHGGPGLDASTGAVVPPIHQSAIYAYPQRPAPDGGWVDSEWVYSRYDNPTVNALERSLASLEGAPAALAFSSGMSAVAAGLLVGLRVGDRVAAPRGLYGGTVALLTGEASARGVGTDWTDATDAGGLADAVTESTRAVLCEVPSNPFNRVLDVDELARRLRARWGRRRPRLVVDATFATPLNLRSLAHGADVAVHSATKYLNGHSDVIAGVLAAEGRLVALFRAWRKTVGTVMDPHQAYLLARGLKTLGVRLRQAERNAKRIARVLEDARVVERVWHLSLPSHPDFRLARRLLDGPGAVVTFQVRAGGRRAARRFQRALRLFYPAPSLGGVESLVSLPVETSHAGLAPGERKRLGLVDGTVRLAVGIEDPNDLEADVRRALRAV